jgi:hypothetical protein
MFRTRERHAGHLEARNGVAIADDGIECRANLPRRGAQLFLPEISLVAAILEDAVRCVQRARPSVTNRQWREAFEWIASERHDWPFAFVNICDFLGVDSRGVRARLGVWPERVGADSDESSKASTHAILPVGVLVFHRHDPASLAGS